MADKGIGTRTETARLVIVTGVSGSGRASTMRVLEDLGFYCVDNLPVVLAPAMLKLASARDPNLTAVALGIDPRERLFFHEWPRVLAELEQTGYRPEILFLDASDEILARRYSESRRPHPLAESGATVAQGIRRERLALAEIRERASRVIDTSTLSVHQLREVVTASILGARRSGHVTVEVVSFGYKYGMPVGLDLVMDVRFLPNPFFIEELRPLDGSDPKVRDYVLAQPEAIKFLVNFETLLKFLLPLYQRESKSYLTIGLGCTGGRHRSPVLAIELQARLHSAGYESQVRHQDIARSASETP